MDWILLIVFLNHTGVPTDAYEIRDDLSEAQCEALAEALEDSTRSLTCIGPEG